MSDDEEPGDRTPMPFGELMGIRVLSATQAEAVCRMRITADHLNHNLIGHGGALFALADTAVGLLTQAGGDVQVGTVFSLDLYRPVVVGDVIEARATVTHRSRSVQFCRAQLSRVSDGKGVGALSVQLLRPGGRAVETGDIELRVVDLRAPLVTAMRTMRHERDGRRHEPSSGPGGSAVVAFDAGQPRGYAVVTRTGDSTAVTDVWVHPTWRGLGIGRRLIADAGPALAGL